MRLSAGLFTLLTLSAPLAAYGQELTAGGTWKCPGANPYTGSPEACLKRMGAVIPPESQAEVMAERRKVTVTLETFGRYVRADTDLTPGEKADILSTASRFRETWLYPENMLFAGAPNPLVKRVVDTEMDRDALVRYRVAFEPGKHCRYMCWTDRRNGEHHAVELLTYRPEGKCLAEVHPAYFMEGRTDMALVAYRFPTVVGGQPGFYTEPAVCHNGCSELEVKMVSTHSAGEPTPSQDRPAWQPKSIGPRLLDEVTIEVNLWQARDIAESLQTVDGRNSRDLGMMVREAAALGKVPTQPGVFPVEAEFIGIRPENLRGKPYAVVSWHEGKPLTTFGVFPKSFGTFGSTLTLNVINGIGKLTLPISKDPTDPSNWATVETAFRIQLKGVRLQYPGRTLQTCAAGTWGTNRGQCGRHQAPGEIPEFWYKAYGEKQEVIHLHHVAAGP